MLPLLLETRALSVLALGAHCDDVEIGAGGLLLLLAGRPARTQLHICTLTGAGTEREQEARRAAELFGDRTDLEVHGLPDGRLPEHWGEAKSVLQAVQHSHPAPDLVLAPRREDAHQDHRTLASLVPQVWRDALVLHYEIPKWDADLGRPNVYVPLPDGVPRAKWELLDDAYPSQRGKDWWDRDVITGLARLRGVECHTQHAEAFWTGKLRLEVAGVR